MAAVLGTVGGYLYFQTKANLDGGIDAALGLRAHELAAEVSTGSRLAALQRRDPLFELIDEQGATLASSPTAHGLLALSRSERSRAFRGSYWTDRGEQTRLLARRVSSNRVVVVGSSLKQRERALEGLATALALGGPLALLLAALSAYWLATRAFSSIETMRARAAAISEASPVGRLPLEAAPDEIRRLGETLNGMLDRIAAAAEHERRFVADASHQLRTPLAILTTELEVALQESGDPAALRASIASALVEANRVTRLADTLLTLAQADERSLLANVADLPLAPVATRVAARLEQRAHAAGREIEVAVPAGLVVRADSVRLEEALGNLVENGVAHGAGTVEISAEQTGDVVRIHVRDQGAGFPVQFVPRAFERFSRASSAGSGTGLGLAIAAAVAAAHGGETGIEHDSRGTDVWLSLPSATVS